jgi:hypothetical protein
MLTLSVEKRDTSAAIPALRRAGSIPAVVYGAHHEAAPITVSAVAFGKVLREAGEATIVQLVGLSAGGGSASGGGESDGKRFFGDKGAQVSFEIVLRTFAVHHK